MTWQLGSSPGVVDAVDQHGRPMPVPLPEQRADLLGDWPSLDTTQLVAPPDWPHAGTVALAFGLGFFIGATAVLVVR